MKRGWINGGSASIANGGFTMVELLTVVGVIGVLATLLASALAGARTRSQQTACAANLRQITIAIEIYSDDTTKRPRSLTRLTQRPAWLGNAGALLCPSDPAVRRAAGAAAGQGVSAAWGNLASPTQQPSFDDDYRDRDPESGSWQAEILEKQETVAFSYLHPLGWPRRAWLALIARGNQAGDIACQLHGVRVPATSAGDRPLYTDYEGRTLRGQRDGAVVVRKIFHDFSPTPGSISNAPEPRRGFPWEFYTDAAPARP